MISCCAFRSFDGNFVGDAAKNPQRIAEGTSAVFSSSPPRFVKTLKMLTTEPFFTTLLSNLSRLPSIREERVSRGVYEGGG